MRFISQQVLAVSLLGLLSCCTTIANAPINVPLHGVPPPAAALPSRGNTGVAIGLAFNGPGAWSIDNALNLDTNGLAWGLAATGAALIGAAGVLVQQRRPEHAHPATG